jgi:autotransporter-associated beta strand protein
VGSITANSTVTLDGTKTVGDLEFANPTSSYTIAAGTGGSLVLDNTSSAAVINDNDGTHTISAPVTLTSSAVVKVINQADKLAISGNVSNTSSPQTLTKNGLGTLALSGNNTYGPVASGTTGTILNAGTLQVGSATALGAGDLSVTASSTLQAGAASVALPNNLTIASGVTATIDTLGNVLKLSGVIGESAASATITKIGLGTLILTGANTYTGATTISNGTLQLGDGVTSGSVAGNIVNNSSLASNLAADATIGNLISGTGGFIKNGTINLTLTNANTFSGTTVLNAGVLTLGNSLALQESTLNYNGQGGTLNFDVLTAVTLGGLSGSQNLTLTNTPATAVALTVGGNNQSTTYSGVLGGNGTGSSLTKIGAGTLTLTNAETYTGATSVQAGTLILSAGASINGTTFSNNATSTNGTFSQLIVNGGSLTTSAQSTVNQGSVGLVLNSGSVTFNGGVRITSGGGDTNALQVFGGTLTSTDVNIGRNQVLNALVTVGTGVGTGGFYVNGGTVNIGTYEIGTNNSSATSRFDAGNTTVTGQITIGNTSNTRWNVLDINGGNFTSTDAVNGIVLSPNLTVANNSEVLVAAGTLTAERIQFGAATSTGTSAIYLGGGSIYLGSGGIVDASGGTGINNVQLVTGTLGAKADWSTSVAVSIGGSFNVKAADSSNVAHNITLSGIITGTGNLTKTGAGKLSLTGSNTFSGSTIIQAGTLELASSSALPSTSTITMSGGTLSVLPGTDVMEGNLFGNGIGAMTLTANSIINFGAGNASNDLLHFDVSSGIAWTGGATLSIYNWNSSTPSSSRTQLFFGSDNTALTGSQLSQIYFYSDSGSTLLGVGAFTADGFGQLTYALVPEPGTGVMLLGGLGLMTLWGRSRRRLS